MRTIGVLLVLCVGVAVDAAAQTRQVGAKIGPTFATLAFDPPNDAAYDAKWGLGGGGFVLLPVAGRLGMQFEALFTPKGLDAPPPAEGTKSTLMLDYLEFPVLVRVTAPPAGFGSLFLFGGPSLGFNTAAKYEIATTGSTITSGVTDDIREDVRVFELGMVAGAGLDIARHVVVDVRYFWGLTNVLDEEGERWKNRGLTILAGVRF
ncbi:MAG TPA: porin family protein [Vicinamibacterales bacterium]|nr:porin family protein [Vicinamibacterales bacterium]